VEALDQSSLSSCSSTSPPIINSYHVSCFTLQTSEDSTDSPSEIDSLDSELVRVAIENFSLDEDDCDALYDIFILDYETGMNHSVKVRMSHLELQVIIISLLFNSVVL
jgi:hypothetical protein